MMSGMLNDAYDETIDRDFGATVARWRNMQGLSQKQLVERLGELGMIVSAPAVSRIENGLRSVRLSEAATIARALRVPTSILVSQLDDSDDHIWGLRSRVRASWRDVRAAASDLLSAAHEVVEALAGNPTQLESFRITSPDDYPAWEARNILDEDAAMDLGKAVADYRARYGVVIANSAAEAEGLSRLASSVTHGVIRELADLPTAPAVDEGPGQLDQVVPSAESADDGGSVLFKLYKGDQREGDQERMAEPNGGGDG